jgi:CRP/FNR family transcriptional regulator, cyclic AMP receptor protein
VSPDERVARLRQIPVLAELGENTLERIIRASSELECPAGQVLIRADDPGAGMFVLEEGTVIVEARGSTIELGPGEIFGELSLLVPESTRVARVRATTPVRCLAIDRAAFEELLDDEPALALAMLRVIARRLWNVMRGPSGGAGRPAQT